MRRYADVTVRRAAVHVVAPRKGELRQSAAEIDLDEDVSEFLRAHVANGLSDAQAVAGRFKLVGPTRPEGLCRSIIASDGDFVARSASLAHLLYEASSGPVTADARISDGTLVVCKCAGDDGGAEAGFAALLKLDPGDAFRAEESIDARGRPVVQLVAQHDILPTPRERLQKAAFVRGEGHDYDALIIDHQRRGEVVSAFFLDGFLGLEQVYDAKARTERFYKTLRRTFDDVRPELSADVHRRLDRYLDGAVVGDRVNLDTVLTGLPTPESVRDRFADALASSLPDREFDTDPAVVRSLVSRRVFVGDNGLRLSVPGDFYHDMVDVTPPPEPDGYVTITIRTRRWSER